MITINELQTILQNLLQRNISQAELGKAMNTGRSNINLRLKNHSVLKTEEITKIEDFYKIILLNVPEFLESDNRKDYKKFYDEHGIQIDIYNMPCHANYKEKENIDDIIEIERIYDIKPSCGSGTDLMVEPMVEPFRISKKTISTYLRCSSPENLKMFQATGDSMEDKIYDGDWLLVDIGRKDVSDSGVFIFTANSFYRCKRLNMTLDGRLEVKSDNSKYDTEIIGPDNNIEIEIIGRVLNNLSRSL